MRQTLRGCGPPQTAPTPRGTHLNQPGLARGKGRRTYFAAQLSKHWNMPGLIKSPQCAKSLRGRTAAGTRRRQNSCKFFHHSSNTPYLCTCREKIEAGISVTQIIVKRTSIFFSIEKTWALTQAFSPSSGAAKKESRPEL